MNKSLILAAILGAAFTSCENESDNFGFQNQDENLISFSTPVVGTSSRAGLSELGYVPGKMETSIYNFAQDFNVFGMYSEKKGASPVAYIDNQLVKYNNSTDVAVWYTEQNYVWPKSGTMTFLAYSPAGAFDDDKDNKKGNVTVEGKNLQIKDFVVPSEIDKQFDLMYTEAQDRNCEGSHERVQLPFKHALSCVTFKLSVASGNLVAGENTNAVLRSITLHNINDKGNFGKKGWTEQSGQSSYELFNDELALTNGVEWNCSNLLLLPQTRTYGSSTIDPKSDAHLEIVWDLYGDNDVKLEQRSIVNLGTATVKGFPVLGKERDQMEWKKGFAYTYNLTLNLDKIEVEGTFDEEQWTDFNDKDLDTSL